MIIDKNSAGRPVIQVSPTEALELIKKLAEATSDAELFTGGRSFTLAAIGRESAPTIRQGHNDFPSSITFHVIGKNDPSLNTGFAAHTGPQTVLPSKKAIHSIKELGRG